VHRAFNGEDCSMGEPVQLGNASAPVNSVQVSMYRITKLTLPLLLLSWLIVPLAGCAPVHAAPEIVSLESHDTVIAPGDSVFIECVAIPRDDAELVFEWTSDRGTFNGHAGMVAWTAPEQEGIARITVTVSNGIGESVSESIAITVKKNTRPVITGLTSNRDWVRPGETATITCAASDADGDDLTYTWSSDCGELAGEGRMVTWTAPDSEGECTVTVVVDDGFGGRASASISLNSSSHEPLLVTEMVVTAVVDPNYLISYIGRYKIYAGDPMIIRAAVNEPDRIVSYEWDDGGTVATYPVGTERITFESGPTEIRWTSPKQSGDYVITVTARGEGDKSATSSIFVNVDTCLCSFPDPED